MDKPQTDFEQHSREAFYAFVGRISLQLVESNADAITVANFLRELTASGGPTLTLEQAIEIATNYVDIADDGLEFSREP
jgi:hypothetical protein